MLKQSSLGETAHWAVSFAAELRVEHRPLLRGCSYGFERRVLTDDAAVFFVAGADDLGGIDDGG